MMNMKLAVLLGCITVPVLPVLAGAASSPASGNVEEYVIEHWDREFQELEGQIKKIGESAIGLQIHDKRMQVEFKDIRLKRLAWAP